jgi:hypothetical protein
MPYKQQFLIARDAYLAGIKDKNPSQRLETFVKEQKTVDLAEALDKVIGKAVAEMNKALKAFNDYRPVYVGKIETQIGKEPHPEHFKPPLSVFTGKLQHISAGFKTDCEEQEKAERRAAAARDPAVVEAKKRVSKVKWTLEEFSDTNLRFLKAINAEKEKAKALKEMVKKVEAAGAGTHDQGTLRNQIQETRAVLAKAAAESARVFREHTEWYLQGPRKGIAPLLKASGLKEEELEKSDREAFVAPLHEMSLAANEVVRIYKTDIEAAIHTLNLRLDTLESQITKSHEEALEDVRRNIAAEIERLKVVVENALAEMNIDNAHKVAGQFRAKKGGVYDRWLTLPKAIAGEIESQKNRLNGIPGKLENVDKQVSRLVKSVPANFQQDHQVAELVHKLQTLAAEHRRNMGEAKDVLEECSEVLSGHLHRQG